MDSFLMFATEDPTLTATILGVVKTIVLVLVGVNMLIIVHEWGHFIVARLCGVKCEKFYIWFDIFGWRFCKFKWGETEYGLGVLPLGGYVKMLGQEDNPGRLREELERAKALQEQKSRISAEPEPPVAVADSSAEPIDIKAAEEALYDPRSYLAKSVPQRMAIISAGVVMNVLFAFVVAMIAYGIGVYKVDSEIGHIAPGGAAWRADLRVGDRVIEVAGKPVTQFDKLREATMLGNIDHGVPIVIERPGVSGPLHVVVEPDRDQPVPTIGIGGPNTTTLREDEPTAFGTPAYAARPKFKSGDRIVAVDGQQVATGFEFHQREAMLRDKPISVSVRRTEQGGVASELTIQVAPRPMRRLGLVMEAGPVAAVQANSPAARAGIKPGDLITAIDGQPLGDPLTLDDRLRRRFAKANAGVAAVELTLTGRSEPVKVDLRLANWYELPLYGSEHAAVTSLGLAIGVKSSVAEVLASSPAAAAGIKPGDVVEAVTPIPPSEEVRKRLQIPDDLEQPESRIDFAGDGVTWSSFFYSLQVLLPGTRVKMELAGGKTAELGWIEDRQWHHPERGFRFEPKETFVRARSLGEVIAYGIEETQNSLLMVFKFLGKVGTRQVSARSVGGPITIVKIAYHYASSRFSDLLIFLCVISANLAVINFLPIPVLDGGHMVFLAYEGIRRKPPSEKVQIGLSYMGLFLLLALMVWVFGLDLGFIPRR
ncbi:MAG: site-2 protease family protein [Thermoguttaceae bacterium]